VFHPIQVNAAERAATQFVMQDQGNTFVAVLNYSASNRDYTINLTPYLLAGTQYEMTTAYTGSTSDVPANGMVTISVAGKDGELIRIAPKETVMAPPEPEEQGEQEPTQTPEVEAPVKEQLEVFEPAKELTKVSEPAKQAGSDVKIVPQDILTIAANNQNSAKPGKRAMIDKTLEKPTDKNTEEEKEILKEEESSYIPETETPTTVMEQKNPAGGVWLFLGGVFTGAATSLAATYFFFFKKN
jgi:hypothetical protein